MFALISINTSQEIDKIVASDFTACLFKNGDLYLWGPTPLG